MLLLANPLGYSLALAATFVIGLGILVGLLIFYIVVQVMAEHRENEERRERRSS